MRSSAHVLTRIIFALLVLCVFCLLLPACVFVCGWICLLLGVRDPGPNGLNVGLIAWPLCCWACLACLIRVKRRWDVKSM